MKRLIGMFSICSVMVLGGIAHAQNTTDVLAPSSQSAIEFRLALRALWQYQVTWTRSYIVSVLAGLDDVDQVEQKLVKNQEQIGNAIKPYYGGMAGNRLAVLLREHIVIAVEIIRAVKAHDQDALRNAQATGRENADAIAELLARAHNPLWDQPSLTNVFYRHLEYVTMQVDYRLKKDWASEIRAYDDGLQHVLLLADILAKGIVQQFPKKFQE